VTKKTEAFFRYVVVCEGAEDYGGPKRSSWLAGQDKLRKTLFTKIRWYLMETAGGSYPGVKVGTSYVVSDVLHLNPHVNAEISARIRFRKRNPYRMKGTSL